MNIPFWEDLRQLVASLDLTILAENDIVFIATYIDMGHYSRSVMKLLQTIEKNSFVGPYLEPIDRRLSYPTQILGYDVATRDYDDALATSNFAGDRDILCEEFASRLNEVHLFDSSVDANEFVAAQNYTHEARPFFSFRIDQIALTREDIAEMRA